MPNNRSIKTCPSCSHEFTQARVANFIGEKRRYCPSGDCNEEIYYHYPRSGPTQVRLIRDKELVDNMIGRMTAIIEDRDHVQVQWPGKSIATQMAIAFDMADQIKVWLTRQYRYLKTKERVDLNVRYSEFTMKVVDERLKDVRDIVNSFELVKYDWEKAARKILSDIVRVQKDNQRRDYVNYSEGSSTNGDRGYTPRPGLGFQSAGE